MTRILACLSFYDERPALLVECIKSLAATGVDHIIAVDGAYALFPDGTAASHPNQHAAITLACRQLGLGLTLHVPSVVWAGNEVEKRNALFTQAWAASNGPSDWFMVHDADMTVTRWPEDLKERLAATGHDAAEIEVLDVEAVRANQPDWPARFTFRQFYRAQPITVGPRHSNYRGRDGAVLWNGTPTEADVPALDLTDVFEVEHRPGERDLTRQLGKMGYYAERDELHAEAGATCSRCEEPSAGLVATRWRMTRIGPVAVWAEACAGHTKTLERVGRRVLGQMGVNPDAVRIENRMGQAPAGMATRG